MKILLTGGLGYIGSHIAKKIGDKAVIIDNQSNSKLLFKKYLPKAKVYCSDLNPKILNFIFRKYEIKEVVHLAALKAVNESLINPIHYYQNNIISTIHLLDCMDKNNIQKFIFSSSATVYGNLHPSPLKECFSLNSVNPYGSTKIFTEQLISDYCLSNSNFKAISLRYFNPLGADYKSGLADQPLGQPQNIMPVLIKSIKQKKSFQIFGNDYPTPDGTCIRDYIHIKDLADAHIKALKFLPKVKGHEFFNIGLGKGISVLEMIDIFEKTNKIKIKYQIASRRKGDVPVSFADNSKSKKMLKWNPKFNYTNMARDSWLAAQR